MAQAAQMHAAEHRGYMPIAGAQFPRELGVVPTSDGLRDSNRRKYMYYRYSGSDGVWRPLPLPAALGHYMGLGRDFEGTDEQVVQRAVASEEAYRLFACPSQPREQVVPSPTLCDGAGDEYGPDVYMGYVFNGSALGLQIFSWAETPAGHIARIRHPADVFLFADGRSLGRTSWSLYGIHGSHRPDETLYDTSRGGSELDYPRHRGRFNVVFVDGHAETLRLWDSTRDPTAPDNSGDLRRVGVTKGIFQ
jgi:prepilin-type processing-associated H-X9-DG protein